LATQPLARARLIGGFQLSAADGAPMLLTSRRARALLTVVCLEGDDGVLRERLCGLLWADRAEEQARASLRQCLFELKAALGDLADQLLDVDRERIIVRAGALDSDVAELRRILAGAQAEELAHLPRLLAGGRLVEGLEIPGLFQDWVEQTRGAFEAGLAADMGRCLERLEAEARWDEVIRLADAYLRRDPLHEGLAAAAMRAERASGRHAAARRRLQAIEKALSDELGVAPSPALVQAALGETMAPTGPAQPAAPNRVTPQAPSPPNPAGPPVLAVLAFDNLSGDPGMTYLSDGVSQEIQQTVSQGSELKVIARSSSFQFRGADKAVRNVAAGLGATHLLDGSIQIRGDRLRISAQLVDCVGEATLWADRVDGDLNHVFELQDQIAAAVAQALKVTLRSTSRPALEPAVYEAYLRARSLVSEGERLFDDAALEAGPLLESVVAAEPRHAAAWALLAAVRAWTLRSGRRQGLYGDGRAGVVAAAEASLRLDPGRGGAYAALAMLEPWGAYAAREALLEKALRTSPNDPDVLTELSWFCWSVGRFHDALSFAERACELNPLMPAARLQVAQMRAYVGDYAASIRMHQELYRRWPRDFTILMDLLNTASTLGFWDAYREAVGDIDHFDGWQATYLRETVRYVEALDSKDPAKAQELLARYGRLVAKTGTLPLNYLVALSVLGLPREAMDLADTASFAHVFDPDGPLPSASFPGTILGPWTSFNRNPRFIDLCQRLGLCAYWARADRWPDCVEWTPYDFKALARGRADAVRDVVETRQV
jgi:TolB-like protein/DNA-binding SARP family transcriptional activator